MTTSSRVHPALTRSSFICRFVLPCLGVLALFAPCAQAGTVFTFGKNAVGTLTSNGLSANFKRGSKFTLPQDGFVSLLCVYLDGNGGASGQQQIRVALYKDASGVPTEKVAESQVMTFTNGDAPNWRCGNVATNLVSAGGYWIVIHSSGTQGIVRDYYDGAPDWYGNADTFSDGAANQFGAGSTGAGTLSAYAYYETAPPSVIYGGRITTAAVPSKGLTADYKRASAFTLSQSGRLYGMGAYLDGNGGAVGSQQLRFALYRDANGLPGAKLAETGTIAVNSGSAANWLGATALPITLSAGRYWLALHSGGTQGVIRDYGDGANSFYANADLFSDGASASFGSGSTGTGTLSAYISLTPGPYFTKTVGRTDVGSLTSGGLTANRQRGSFFFTPDQDAVVTALYAYLDGFGGAAGAQQLRMCIYLSPKNGGVRERAVTSDVVTVRAGTAPGWVRFPVTPTALNQYYGFAIMIHSGDVGGVVRDYYGGPSTTNWVGWSDTFADGPAAVAPGQATGTGTLSIYAEYTSKVQ